MRKFDANKFYASKIRTLTLINIYGPLLPPLKYVNLHPNTTDMTNRESSNKDKGLNPQQRQAVEATEGRIRIVAGAGSGKTRVIAHRYAYLVNELGIDPGNILCTSFTNKSAREMTLRISRMVSRGNYNDFVCTLHGFCVKFLRQEIHRLGWPATFHVLDESDAKQLAAETLDQLGISRKDMPLKQVLENVSRQKAIYNTAYVAQYLAPTNPIPEAALRDVFNLMMHKQLKLFALDFDDLIYATLYILETFPDVLTYWNNKLNYVMVDEAQDISSTQWRLVELLAQGTGNLFIVGDPDQAIYEWRGASPSLFVNFRSHQDIILNRNYRSTPDILDVANSIIAHNTNRVEKDLFTLQPHATRVVHHHAKTEDEEAKWIATNISEAVAKGANPSDFAILFRAAHLSRAVEQALIQKGIKYSMWGGVRFFERYEIKNLLAYMRLVIDGNDNLSLLRVLNVPSRKLGKVFVGHMKEVAAQTGLSYFETLRRNPGHPKLGRKQAQDFVDIILECRLKLPDISISNLANFILERSGLKAEIRESGDDDRLDNLNELINSIKRYEEENAENDPTPAKYLQDIALYTNADHREDKETVKLMTIHQSKGLEFPYVFLTGVSEGILPNYRSLRERKRAGEEEERRLMYVAVTRAEKALFLSESEGFLSAAKQPKYPSRFLPEIKKGLLEVEGEIPRDLWEGTRQMVSLNEPVMPEKGPGMGVGMNVEHKIFGRGTIVEVGENNVTIQFAVGRRTLQPSFVTPVN